MEIKGLTIKGLTLGGVSLKDIPGAYYWLNPGEPDKVTTPVGTRISSVRDIIANIDFGQSLSASRPALVYRSSIAYVNNFASTFLQGVNQSDFNLLHSGVNWTTYLAANTSTPVGVFGTILNNATASSGNVGFNIAIDNRQSGAGRTNGLSFYLSDFTTGNIFNVNCGDNTYPQNTNLVLKVEYTRTGTSAHQLKLTVFTTANKNGTTYTFTSATVLQATVGNATSVLRCFRGPSGSYTTGYLGEVFIINGNGKSNDQRLADQLLAENYFTTKYL